MNIYLIGYRCTGKTSVGKCLAQRMGWSFVDTDARIAARVGEAIADMVSAKGWDFFREREAAVLEEVAAVGEQVVSTGGGMVLRPENCRLMKHSGVAVWLTARVGTILSRIRRDAASVAQRPALTDAGQEEEVRRTLAERLPLYARTADLALATDTLGIEAICDEILQWARLNLKINVQHPTFNV